MSELAINIDQLSISYTTHRNMYANLEYKPMQLDEMKCTNISLYNADNSNKPCSGNQSTLSHYQTQNNNTSVQTITIYH